MSGAAAPRSGHGPLGPVFVAGGVALALLAIAGSRVSMAAFGAAAGGLVALLAVAALAWPRRVLVVVALSPILDRYLVPGLLTPEAESLARFLSEGLLLVVGAVLAGQAAARGRLREALDHPTVWLAAGFTVLAIVSAIVNGVPASQAAAGIGFTLDALIIFVLARIAGFTTRQATYAIGGLIGLALLAALVAVAQALLSPHILGLSALQGRYGELYRLAAFFGDPNTFAAFLSAAIPFALFGTTGFSGARWRRLALAAAVLMVLALWLSFSRGGWLGAIGGFVLTALILDRRAAAIGLGVAVATLSVALLMPRDLLGDTGQRRPDLLGSTFGRFGTVGEGRDLRTLFAVNALPIIGDHPVLGVGPGRYGGAAADLFGTPVYAEYGTDELFVDPEQTTVDDFWLHLLVESGVAGLLAFAAMVGAVLRPVLRAARGATGSHRVLLSGIAGASAALVINSLTTMLLEANSMAFPFWLLLGIGSMLAAGPMIGRLAPEAEPA